MKTFTSILLLAVTGLSGCYVSPLSTVVLDPQYQTNKLVKLTAVGYGSASTHERYNDGQKRLMAMRASKLDAYRAIAEQVYGVRVTGSSTVGALVAQNDNFRVSVDAYLRGARVSNVTQIADGSYETTIEMDFDESIVRAFVPQAPVRAVTLPAYNPVYNPVYVNRAASYGPSYYYAE